MNSSDKPTLHSSTLTHRSNDAGKISEKKIKEIASIANKAIAEQLEAWGLEKPENGKGLWGHLYGNSATSIKTYLDAYKIYSNANNFEKSTNILNTLQNMSYKDMSILGKTPEETFSNCKMIASTLQEQHDISAKPDAEKTYNDIILDVPLCNVSNVQQLNDVLMSYLLKIGTSAVLKEIKRHTPENNRTR